MDRKHLAPRKLFAFPPGFIRDRLLYMEKNGQKHKKETNDCFTVTVRTLLLNFYFCLILEAI